MRKHPKDNTKVSINEKRQKKKEKAAIRNYKIYYTLVKLLT
jgi:hypothetical protein